METKLSGHSVYRTEYHIVWVPKYRRRILNPDVKGYISKLFLKILRSMPGCEIIEQNIQVGYIHLLMVIPPKYAVSEVIGQVKQYTASKLREKFAWLGKVYWKERVVWSSGYFVSTVRLDAKQITEYVKWQGYQDSGQAKLDL
ncbi:MAG: IS200/IS605 family transposase [Chloroflexi bacterium]|nr:IS200/IS605 family transposase [Chloroflexota bacterium]